MDSVVFGQYVKSNSFLHRLDARIKIVSLILLIVALFLFESIYFIIGSVVLLFIIIICAKIPFNKIVNGLKPLLFLLVITFIIQSVYAKGGKVYDIKFSLSLINIFLIIILTILVYYLRSFNKFKTTLLFIWFIGIFLIQHFITNNAINTYHILFYEEGIIRACFIFLRLICIVVLSSLLTFTTMPMDLNNAIEDLLKPLKIIKVPTSEISMMISITLRFIPTLLEETNKIMRSQAARGVDFSSANLKNKVSQMISLLVPMFVISFKRAEDLAYAMEARGYKVGAKRTKYDLLKIKFKDYFVLVLVIAFLVLAVIF